MASSLLFPDAVLSDFIREIRLSVRGLVRTPVWTAGLVLTLALGIGSSASVDGFVRGLTGNQLAAAPATRPDAAGGLAAIAQLLWISASAIFLIACANAASFLLARATARARETAVRVAIGAGRAQLFRQVLADSVALSIAGAIIGSIFAMWIGRIVPALLFDQDADQMIFAAAPARVVLTALIGAAVTIACGMLPLMEMRHDNPGAIMQREIAGPSRRAVRLGQGLVIVQMTACTLLVVSTGLLLAGFQSALQTSAGRRLSAPIVVSVEGLQMSSEAQEANAGREYFAAVAGAAAAVAGVKTYTWTANVPGNRPNWRRFYVEAAALPRRTIELQPVPFTPSTVDTIVLPPVAGRLFSTHDIGACSGVVLSREAAQIVGGNQVVGRSIELPTGQWVDVIGVVATREPERAGRLYFYQSPAVVEPEVLPRSSYRVVDMPEHEPIELDVNIVTSNYFDFMALQILAGRGFADQHDACRVAVVNQQAADRYFGGHAVGGAIVDGAGRRTVIIGVVGSNTLRVMQRDVQPGVYFPATQDYIPRMTLIAETPGVGRATLERLHRRITTIPGGRDQFIIVNTLDRHLSRTAFAPERIATVLVSASTAIALLLGVLALYGVMSDAARRRQREFALRIALGAQGRHVMGQVVGSGMRQVAIGTVAGTAGALILSQFLASVAPAEGAWSPLVWLAAPASLALALLMASVLPARRALTSNPLMIMRSE